jgi:hypothetical protein
MQLTMEYEGSVYIHRIHLTTAKVFLKAAKAEQRGSYYNALAALAFSWMAYEAYLNCLIEHLDPVIFKDERDFFTRRNGFAGVQGKLAWIIQKCSVLFDEDGTRLFERVEELRNIRNELMHAKPIHYKGKREYSSENDGPWMENQWIDEVATPEKAEMYCDAVERACDWLHARITPEFLDPHLRRYAFKGTTQSQTSATGAL